ncbi:MAG: hypothetical protein ACKVW3_02550 [Phycisphaerales bacterium]
MPLLRKIAGGYDHVLALTDDPAYAKTRGLLGWGRNDDGQSAIPLFDEVTGVPLSPWSIDANAKVIQIAAGEYINIVLFDNGQIAAWGDGNYGVDPRKDGVGATYRRYTGYIENPTWRFKQVIAGGHFVAALRSDPGHVGEIVSWGGWDYAAAVARGPGYRLGDSGVGVPPGGWPSPQNPDCCTPENPKCCNLPNVYAPPYAFIAGGHVTMGGIREPNPGDDAGVLDLWGDEERGSRADHPGTLMLTFAAGYSQWMIGWQVNQANSVTLWGGPQLPSSGDLPAGVIGSNFKIMPGNANLHGMGLCYTANCDQSTVPPVLNINDFFCFANKYAEAEALPYAQQLTSYANCDGSTTVPVLTVNDYNCFLLAFSTPCP